MNKLEALQRLSETNRLAEAIVIAGDDIVRLKALLEIAVKISEGQSFAFSGMNCETDCSWDGISRRCNCGNRRVSWEWNDSYYRGEAY